MDNHNTSLKENGAFFLHSYSLKFTLRKTNADQQQEEQDKEDVMVKARLSLQIRTFLSMLGVKEKVIYADLED